MTETTEIQNSVAEAVTESQESTPPEKRTTRELTRREFLRLAAGLGVGLIAANQLWNWFVAVDDPLEQAEKAEHEGPHWVMVIDLGKCIGCRRCEYACQATNDTAPGHLWNIILEDEETYGEPTFIPRPCMHCEHAPCVEVCPVQATYHRPDGLVAMDYDRCIGCRYCMVACPYGSRVFNWGDREDENPQVPTWGEPEVERRPRGVVEKCTFCVHRLDAAEERGLTPGIDEAATPACCNICPTEARIFGDLRDPESRPSVAMKNRQAVVMRSELGTHPRVYYLLPT